MLVPISQCLASCNTFQSERQLPIIVRDQRSEIIIPEPIPAALFVPVECPRIPEQTWADAKRSSEYYRTYCMELANERIRSIGVTVQGRWEWMASEAERRENQNNDLKNGAAREN